PGLTAEIGSVEGGESGSGFNGHAWRLRIDYCAIVAGTWRNTPLPRVVKWQGLPKFGLALAPSLLALCCREQRGQEHLMIRTQKMYRRMTQWRRLNVWQAKWRDELSTEAA